MNQEIDKSNIEYSC